MPQLINPYDRQLLRNQAAIIRKILEQYEAGILSLVPTISTIKYKGELFRLADYPALQKRVEAVTRKLQNQIYTTIVNGVKDSWDLSNRKNNVLVDKRLSGKHVKAKVRQVLYDPNAGALKAFIDRKEKGLNLSERVWKGLEPFKSQLEQTVGIGIGKGEAAADMAKGLKQYLRDPDNLFRRVRGEDGKLYLSQAARNYHPGRGVYRSSFKNAMRLARTETNGSYRSADHERWKKLPFVTGIRIKLSNAHPRFDICDHLVGLYPKDFKFQGWHAQCICFATPEMMSDEEYDRLESAILNGEQINTSSASTVTRPPAAFGKYLKDNKEKLSRLKNEPYWIRDNKQYVNMSERQSEKIRGSGNKIGPQFTNISRSIRAEVHHTLESIDEVHGDGVLDDIPFRKSSSKQFNAQFAFYPSGKAKEIVLGAHPLAKEISLAHEMGHYLDLYSIGPAGKLGSVVKDSASNKVVQVAEKSKAIQRIRKLIDQGYVIKKGVRIPISSYGRRHLEYLVKPEEIWARSYAQYIAEKSGSVKMKEGIEKIIEKDKAAGIYQHQWDQDDFKEILEAIDEMMEELGWVTNL